LAKVELVGEMKHIKGWNKVAKLVKKRLKRSIGYSPYKIIIRALENDDKNTEMTRTGGKEHLRNFISIDTKKKNLVVAFEPEPDHWPEGTAKIIFGILRINWIKNMRKNINGLNID